LYLTPEEREVLREHRAKERREKAARLARQAKQAEIERAEQEKVLEAQ
jgi:hypothetical protein